jgi:hypothetical protein
MSFILTDRADDGHELQVNAWHWRTILMLLTTCKALPEERIEVMGISGACPELSESEVRQVAAALRAKVLPGLEADDRVMIDGTFTKTSDDGRFHREDQELHKNYSTNKDVLTKVCEFCETAKEVKIY